jgi:hypothetical protein
MFKEPHTDGQIRWIREVPHLFGNAVDELDSLSLTRSR